MLTLPEAGASREQAILEHVGRGNFEVEWSRLTSERGGRKAEFQVFSDALKVEGVRVGMSAETQQKVADMLGCSLLTPKLADLAWSQRDVTLRPRTKRFSAATELFFEHSGEIDVQLAELGRPSGLKQTVGKHWVISEKLKGLGMAMNYGWHFEGEEFEGVKGGVSASGILDATGRPVRVIQGCGTRHDMHHSDYSQTCTLVSRSCVVDGQSADIRDLLADPVLSWLASHEGPMTVLRQPGVPEWSGPFVISAVVVTPD